MKTHADNRHTVEYAPNGLIGVLTPQANTTVEPELAILCPAGYAFINARLVSDKTTIEARLADYIENIDAQLSQFANAPIDALAIATTGVSYLVGADKEDQLIEQVFQAHGIALVTTAKAVCDALSLLPAKNIVLVSPYPPALTDQSVEYWTSRQFSVTDVVSLYEKSTHFHPIYSMSTDRVNATVDGLSHSDADVILMLGTGMPTLATIAEHATWDGPAVMSCMLSLAWRSIVAAGKREPNRSELEQWIGATHWSDRLLPQSHEQD